MEPLENVPEEASSAYFVPFCLVWSHRSSQIDANSASQDALFISGNLTPTMPDTCQTFETQLARDSFKPLTMEYRDG